MTTEPEIQQEDQGDGYYGSPIMEEKHNTHSFLNKVVTEKDTTKLGNLSPEEIGEPSKTLRTYKEMSLIADKIISNDTVRNFYTQKGEIITSTSLSKNAKLLNLSVVQKRVVEDETKQERKENPGWFKKKNKEEAPA